MSILEDELQVQITVGHFAGLTAEDSHLCLCPEVTGGTSIWGQSNKTKIKTLGFYLLIWPRLLDA